MYDLQTINLDGIDNCSPETDTEVSLKEKAHTTEEFRLACQTTVNGDIVVRRLVLNKEDIEYVSEKGVSGRLGETKKIAILFSDIRGFTPFSEKLTPYDVVFILNRYFPSRFFNGFGHLIFRSFS